MGTTGVMTDSHSGIGAEEAVRLGIKVLPMPFYVNEKLYREGVDISREEFYDKLREGVDVATSQPSPEEVMELWDQMLTQYECIDTDAPFRIRCSRDGKKGLFRREDQDTP